MIGALISLFVLIFCGIIGLLIFAFWIWMIIDAIQNKGLSDGEKIGWVLAVVFLHILGAILYFFIGRPKSNTPLAN
jgi:phosphotransferase system  glucose/maltose/N-acetylglucosamine-specific IIC component